MTKHELLSRVPIAIAAVLAFFVLPAPAAERGSSESLIRGLEVQLSVERKLLTADLNESQRLGRRVETHGARQLVLASELRKALAEGEAAIVEELRGREAELTEVEAVLAAARSQAREVRERVYTRMQRLQLLTAELTRAKQGTGRTPDPISGSWEVTLFPSQQQGTFDLDLSGTIVSGGYSLAGGFHGSLRGTFVGNRLRLERIDSELGFSTIYYGRLGAPRRDLSGTWESTLLSEGGPAAGTWSGRYKESIEPGVGESVNE